MFIFAGIRTAFHATGPGGGPKLDDKAAWAPCVALGKSALYASVLNGKGAMLPKGGQMKLSDDVVTAAVESMPSQIL